MVCNLDKMVDSSSIEQEVEYPSIGSHNNSNNNNDIWDHFDHLSQSIYSTMNAADNFREYIEESVVMNEEVETLIFVADNIKIRVNLNCVPLLIMGMNRKKNLKPKQWMNLMMSCRISWILLVTNWEQIGWVNSISLALLDMSIMEIVMFYILMVKRVQTQPHACIFL